MLPLLTVTDRSIRLRRNTDSQTLVHNVSFSLNAGECLGIVGESGAGKTLTVRSLFGLLPPNLQPESRLMLTQSLPPEGSLPDLWHQRFALRRNRASSGTADHV